MKSLHLFLVWVNEFNFRLTTAEILTRFWSQNTAGYFFSLKTNAEVKNSILEFIGKIDVKRFDKFIYCTEMERVKKVAFIS